MTNDEKIRAGIRSVMTEKGIRQAELARAIGVTPQSLNQVVGGARAALPKSLTAVLDELDLELAVKTKDDEDVLVPVVRAAPEKPEGGPTPDERTWLESFLAAAKDQETSAPPYDHGTILLVKFDGQVRPCVNLSLAATARKTGVYGVVPLALPVERRPVGGLTPTFSKEPSDLPADCIALCAQVRTVELTQVVGFVGNLESRQFKRLKKTVNEAVTELFALEYAVDGRKLWKSDETK